MIDYKALSKTFNEDGIYALQLEAGDVCYQNCTYCYMNALHEEVNTLTDRQISEILDDSARLGIKAIEWLGGEPLLRESIYRHMEHAAGLGLRNNIWTGGLPFENEETLEKISRLARHGLISFHISTIDPEIYRKMHPERPVSDINTIVGGVEKLMELGYPADQMINSVTYTGLQPAGDMIRTIDFFEENYGVKTSMNIYHTYLRPGMDNSDLQRFIPDKKETAEVYKRYNKQWGVKQMPMNCVNKEYCSATAAILNNGAVTPCATIRDENAPNIHTDGSFYEIAVKNRDYLVFKELKNEENLPEQCKTCRINDQCWGCRSRAYAADMGMPGPDPRCFRAKEKS